MYQTLIIPASNFQELLDSCEGLVTSEFTVGDEVNAHSILFRTVELSFERSSASKEPGMVISTGGQRDYAVEGPPRLRAAKVFVGHTFESRTRGRQLSTDMFSPMVARRHVIRVAIGKQPTVASVAKSSNANRKAAVSK